MEATNTPSVLIIPALTPSGPRALIITPNYTPICLERTGSGPVRAFKLGHHAWNNVCLHSARIAPSHGKAREIIKKHHHDLLSSGHIWTGEVDMNFLHTVLHMLVH